MHTYIVSNITKLTPSVILLTLRPKRTKGRLLFAPGQYASLSLHTKGRPTPVRCFSIVSSPSQPDELQFAMKIEGNFTQTAAALQPGNVVQLQGPFGAFIIDPAYDKQIVMLAGGIGITPFISMLRRARETALPIPITLLYSCRSEDEIAFYQELLALEQQNSHLQVRFFIGNKQPSNNNHLIGGRITDAWLNRITTGSFTGSSYFLCGPKPFMHTMQKGLRSRGITSDHLIAESFTQAVPRVAAGGIRLSHLTYAVSGGVLALGVLAIMTIDILHNTSSAKAATTTPVTTSSTTVQTPATTYTVQPAADASPTTTAQNVQTYQTPMSSVS